MSLLGAILAGGRSSRFGSDKAVALLDGAPLAAHAARTLGPYVADVVVCGRTQPIAGLTAIADWPRPDLGPLGGLCGALRYAAAHGYASVISIGCDMPSIPDELIERLLAVEGAAYVAEVPILGCWPAALANKLAAHLLEQDDRSMRAWTALIGATPLGCDADIPNLNRPEDLARLERSARIGTDG